jgi:1-acyl-sn-glycerol-3-phosphate acyltransferase
MGHFKPGLGMLVAGADVPVVPCHIQGAFQAMPPGARIPRWRKITLRVGQALNFKDASDDRPGWEQIAQQTRQAVEALAPKGSS